MNRLVVALATAVVICAAGPTAAQVVPRHGSGSARTPLLGELNGRVTDQGGRPVAGAVVAVVGDRSVTAVTNRAGEYRVQNLPPGPYVVRAHLPGFLTAAAIIIQVNGGVRTSHPITLTSRGASELLTAGVGGTSEPETVTAPSAPTEADATDEVSERAWRVRHRRRSVLESSEGSPEADASDDSDDGDALGTLGRAVTSSVRLASSVIGDLPISGRLNLLATSSFDRPHDLFQLNTGAPLPVAYLSLAAPSVGGEWTMNGALTQGDLSSWALAGSYVRTTPSAHAYEAGVSYSMQRYLGGNAVALAAVPDGQRTAGAMYAVDRWRVAPAVTVSYGAEFARYGYLETSLLSPSVAMLIRPAKGTRVRTSAARRQRAPGAEEFRAPNDAILWRPPERTFSSLSNNGRFVPERVIDYSADAEQDLPGRTTVGVRAFHQDVNDQLVTVFGLQMARAADSRVGHYHMLASGDVTVSGWGVRVSRSLTNHVRASVDYGRANADWTSRSRDVAVLVPTASEFARGSHERIHDLTTSVDAEFDRTATRVYVMYRVSSSAAVRETRDTLVGTRFDVQVQQALRFLNFTSAQWGLLVAVRNVFHDGTQASLYDELLVVRPPTRVMGGLTVRF